MSRRGDELRELRMELLRMRAALERAEVAGALAELREGTGRLRGFADGLGSLGRLGAGLSGGSGWIGLATGVLRHPWLAAFALKGVRALKRSPWLLAVTAVAALAGLGLHRRGRDRGGADDDLSGPAPGG